MNEDREYDIFVFSSKLFQRWVPMYEKRFWPRVDLIFGILRSVGARLSCLTLVSDNL